MTDKKLIPGATLTLRGQDFIVPPLTFGQLEDLEPHFQALRGQQISDTSAPAYVSMFIILHEAISTNYPDLTLSALKRLVDPANLPIALEIIMGVSGLQRSKGDQPGEAQAGN